MVIFMNNLLKITGDDKPGNIPSYEVDLNNGGWTVIIILICLVLALVIILFVTYHMYHSKMDSLKKLMKNELSENEMRIILTYRKLNDNNKAIITGTLKTLENNNENPKE